MDPVKEFYTDLSRILEPYKDKLQNLADEAGVSKVSLWRWLNGINRKYPDVNRVLPVLAKISGLNDRKELGKYFGGFIEDFIKDFCPISSEVSMNILGSEYLEEGISDFYSFVIFSVCETKRGASEEELVNIVGNIAVKRAGVPQVDINQEIINTYGLIAKGRIKELKRKELIYLADDGYFHSIQNDISLNLRFSLEHLPYIIKDMTKPEDFSKGYNAIFSYTESIPLDIAKNLAKKTKKFFMECYEEMEKSKSKDGVPFTVINYAERLWFDPMNNSQKGEVL